MGKSDDAREREGNFYGTEKERPLGLREREGEVCFFFACNTYIGWM